MFKNPSRIKTNFESKFRCEKCFKFFDNTKKCLNSNCKKDTEERLKPKVGF